MSTAIVTAPNTIAFAIPRRPSYPPPQPPTTTTTTTTTLPSSTADEATMPARPQINHHCAPPRYTPRRRNALVPLPLLPPVPPHVVVKRIQGVVKILAAANAAALSSNESKDVEMSDETEKKVAFPTATPEEQTTTAPEAPAVAPLRPRIRKDSLTLTPRFTVPLPAAPAAAVPTSDASLPDDAAPTKTTKPMPRPSFPVRPLAFNNSPANRKPVFEPIVFPPTPWSRPRLASPLNPASVLSSLSAAALPAHVPARTQLHPNHFLRPRPRVSTTAPLAYPMGARGAWAFKQTLARGGKHDELRRCTLLSCENGRRVAWMHGDVRGAVEIWEAERALEELEEDEDMLEDDGMMDEIVDEVYARSEGVLAGMDKADAVVESQQLQPQVTEEEDEVVCTGERKAEKQQQRPHEHHGQDCCVVFEGPTTCVELDMELLDVEMEMGEEDDVLETTAHRVDEDACKTWSDVFEVDDDGEEF